MSKIEFSNELSECEEMIMSLLLDSEEDLTLQEVTDKMKSRYNKEWKLQTVATFLTRMKKKGYISIYRIGRYSHYHAEYGANDMRMKALQEVAGLYFNGSTEVMHQFMLNNGLSILPGNTVYYTNKKLQKIEPAEVISVTLTKNGVSQMEGDCLFTGLRVFDIEERNKMWFLSEDDAKKALEV